MAEFRWDPDGKPRKPQIVGIGAQKAGTSWLSQMLGQHPRVWTTPFKEVQFFNHRFIPGHQYWIRWHYRTKPEEIRARFRRRGEVIPAAMDAYLDAIATHPRIFTDGWYKQVFAPAPKGTRPMDVTPEYSTLPPAGVAHVAAFLPNARFLYLIRDPVDRAVSQLKMNLLREKRRPATEADWLAEVANPVLQDRGDYAAYIPRWQQAVGERVLILPYGRIAAEPDALLAEVERFLGLPEWEYRNPRTRVFATPEGIEVPPAVVAALREILAPQYAFLRDAFGPAFLDAIR